MSRILVVALMLAAGSAQALTAGPARADAGSVSLPPAPASASQRDGVTLEEAVRRVRRQYGGRIISAETRGRGDRRVHVIKVLTDDGRVRTVRIPAN